MRTEILNVANATGALLSAPVFHSSGKKLLGKGRLLCDEDIQMLVAEGHCRVKVAVLEDGEISEDEAAIGVAMQGACGSMEIQVRPGGRVHLRATENCCLLLDEQLLRTVNLSRSVTVATAVNFSYAATGSLIATINTAPFAVRRSDYDNVLEILATKGPLIQARPIRDPVIGVLYTDPRCGERARELFDAILCSRLARLGASEIRSLTAHEDEQTIARHLDELLAGKPTLVLVASTTAPAGPEDVVGRSMRRIGCRLECFMAPVEPGNLLLLAYADEIPVVAAPGCFRWKKANVLDLVLPPLLARYLLSAEEIACWGHRGLLQ